MEHILPQNIENFLGKKICTFETLNMTSRLPTEKDWDNYLFKTEEERQNASKFKEKLLEKIGYIADNPNSHQ